MGTGVANTSETGQAHVKPLTRFVAIVFCTHKPCEFLFTLIIIPMHHTEPKAPDYLLRFAQDGILYATKVYNAKSR